MALNAREIELEKSFLVADCGSAYTTAVLFDVVAGTYRLVARATVPTTVTPPWSDLSRGVRQAISQIAEITGRTFLSENGRLLRPTRKDGSGIDHFIVVASAAPPLSVLLVGLFDEVSLSSARKALRSAYTYEVDSFNLADNRSEEELITAVIQARPDVIVITGGTDGGAADRLLRLIETVSVGINVLAQSRRQQVIFAGNINLRERVRELISSQANVQMVNNVRPNLDVEHLEDLRLRIAELYEDIKLNAMTGMQDLQEWRSFPSQSTARAFTGIVHYFAALNKQQVLGVDLGSSSVTMVWADADKANTAVNVRLGMGWPLQDLLDKISPARIDAWLDSPVSHEEIADFVLNRSLRPHSIPATDGELRLEQAVAREVLRCALEETAVNWGWSKAEAPVRLPPFGLLLARGSLLAHAARPGQTILTLLDALQPTGVFTVAVDQYGVLPALGALASHHPLAVVQALEGGVMANWGWVIAPMGKGQPGKKALALTIESDKGNFSDDVEFGKIETFPVAPEQTVTVTVRPTGRFDIGKGPGQSQKMKLHGGPAGGLVVIDARGRPLSLPKDDEARRELVRRWHWDIGG